MAEQAHPSLTRNAAISRGEPQSASQSRIPTAALIGRWLDQARPRQRLGQVIVQFNPRVGIAWRSSELFEDNLASLPRRRTCAAQIEALEQVVRLRLWSGEVVPAVLPPESIQADVEFFQRVGLCLPPPKQRSLSIGPVQGQIMAAARFTTYISRQMRLERRFVSRSPKRRPRIHSRHWRRQRRWR